MQGQPLSSQPEVLRQLLASQDSDPGEPSNMVTSWDHVRQSTAKQAEGKKRAGAFNDPSCCEIILY